MFSYPANSRIMHRGCEILADHDGFVHRAPERFLTTPAGVKVPHDVFIDLAPEALLALHGVRPWRQEHPPAGYRATAWETIVDADSVGLVKVPVGIKPMMTLGELRTARMAEVKEQAYRRLLPTDWYAARLAETGETIPQDVLLSRAEIRSVADTAEADLAAFTGYDDMLAYRPAWPEA